MKRRRRKERTKNKDGVQRGHMERNNDSIKQSDRQIDRQTELISVTHVRSCDEEKRRKERSKKTE